MSVTERAIEYFIATQRDEKIKRDNIIDEVEINKVNDEVREIVVGVVEELRNGGESGE